MMSVSLGNVECKWSPSNGRGVKYCLSVAPTRVGLVRRYLQLVRRVLVVRFGIEE